MNATPVRLASESSTDPESTTSYTPYETTRFGEVQIADDSVIRFPEGIVGLVGSSYALLSTDPGSPFMWLQSLDDPAIALPVTNPHRFFGDYVVELADGDAEHLGLTGEESTNVIVTVTASAALAEFTANLKAPILVWNGEGHQVINQTPGVAVKTPLFANAS